jgi:hypothetical protein
MSDKHTHILKLLFSSPVKPPCVVKPLSELLEVSVEIFMGVEHKNSVQSESAGTYQSAIVIIENKTISMT